MKKTIKQAVSYLLALCLLLALPACFTGCASRPPKIGQIYDRVVELVESSYSLNTVFYGAGLPVYEKGSTYAELAHLYFGATTTSGYELITPYALYRSEDDIKAAAEQVYSRAYLDEVIYPALFEGYAIEGINGSATHALARYLQEQEWLYQDESATNYLTHGMRIYDYSTMKIVRPSNGQACYVSMNSWMPDSPDVISTNPIRLVLQDDGQWYLDSFTG